MATTEGSPLIAEGLRDVKQRLDRSARWIIAATGAVCLAAFSSGGAVVWGMIASRHLSVLGTIAALVAAAAAVASAIWAVALATGFADVTIVDPFSMVMPSGEQLDGGWQDARRTLRFPVLDDPRREYLDAWRTYLDEARAVAHDHSSAPDESGVRKAHAWLHTLHAIVMAVAEREAAQEIAREWRMLRRKLQVALSMSLTSVGALVVIVAARL
jgi:hypothetical protein